MEYRTLGKTGMKVSLGSFGTGGPSQFGQKKGLEQQQQTKLIHHALDLGINLFDTHERYGQSEDILGAALHGVPRDSYYLSTKWAYHGGGNLEWNPQALADSIEQSLSRLRTDHIDLMLIHGILSDEYDRAVEQFVPTLERFQEQGKIGYKGFSLRYIQDPGQETTALALKKHPDLWDAIMLKYGILNQLMAKEALPLALEHNVGILNMASVRIKLPVPHLLEELIADWKAKGYIGQDSLPEKDPLGWLVQDDVDSVISAAYKFGADHPAVSTVVIGTSSAEHLDANVAALANPHMPEADKQRLIELFGDICEYA